MAVCLGIVLRLPAQIIGRAVIGPAPVIRRNTKQGRTTQHRHSEHTFNQPDQIIITQPGGQHTMILRLRLTGCDTHTGALNPEFRMIEAGQRLTKRLGHAVQGVRYDVDLVIKIFSWRVIPHRMNGTGIENPVAAVMARGLIKIVKALNIGIPDNAPRTFGCLSAKMQDAITSGHQTHDRLAIGKISLHHLFMYRRCTKIVPVTDANGFSQMRNMLAAMAAQHTCGTGNQQTLHRHGRSPVKKNSFITRQSVLAAGRLHQAPKWQASTRHAVAQGHLQDFHLPR